MHTDNNLLGKVLFYWWSLKSSCITSFFILRPLYQASVYLVLWEQLWGVHLVCVLFSEWKWIMIISMLNWFSCAKKFFNRSFTRWYRSRTHWAQSVPYIWLTGMIFTLKVVGLGSYSGFFIFLQFLFLIIINIVERVILVFFQIIRESFFRKLQRK